LVEAAKQAINAVSAFSPSSEEGHTPSVESPPARCCTWERRPRRRAVAHGSAPSAPGTAALSMDPRLCRIPRSRAPKCLRRDYRRVRSLGFVRQGGDYTCSLKYTKHWSCTLEK
jgi:hypothetical protein